MFNRSTRIIQLTLLVFAMVLAVSPVSATGIGQLEMSTPSSTVLSNNPDDRPERSLTQDQPGRITPTSGSQYGDFVELGESYDHSGTWAQKTHEISAYAGQEVCLAFIYQGSDSHTWFIDDILVTSDNGTHLDETFSDETFPPDGWELYELGSNPDRQWARNTSVDPNSPPASAWHDWTRSNFHDDNWLVTPKFTLGENPELTYYDRMTFISWYSYSGVWISTTGSCDPTAEPTTITIEPDEMNASQPTDAVTTQILTIGNSGDGTLEWDFDQAAPPAMAVTDDPIPSTISEMGESAMDLRSVLGVPLPAGLSPMPSSINQVVDCEVESGIIIHDDGTINNGYTRPPDDVNEVIFVDLFTPSDYPASFTAVCVAFLSLGPTSLDFDVVLFANDGPAGAPGTELGSLPVSASDIPIWPDNEPVWLAYDISVLDVSINTGSVYIGVRYEPQ